MKKQDEYSQQKILQGVLNKVSKFDPETVPTSKTKGSQYSNMFTILNDGGDRFAVFFVKILIQEKDYLISKVKNMSIADLEDIWKEAEDEAQAFIDKGNK